jgi:hypothetical protein
MSLVRKGLATRPRCPHRRLHLVPLALAANLFAGCYAFVPTDFSAPEPGQTVRLDMSEPGRQALIPRFGPGIQEVEGMALATSADSMSMLVHLVQTRQGSTGVGGEAVRLTPADVTGVYERRLSRTRSLLLGVGALAAAFLLVDQFGDAGRQFSDDDVDPPIPPQIRLPLVGGSGAVFQR